MGQGGPKPEKNLRIYVVEGLMRQHGYNQRELAEASGLDKTTINKYLRRKSFPNQERAELMAKALGCSVDDIVEDREKHMMEKELEKKVCIAESVDEVVPKEPPKALDSNFMNNYYELGNTLTKIAGYMDIIRLDLDAMYDTIERCNMTDDKLLRFKGRHFDDLVDILERMGLYQRKEHR